LIHRRNNLHTRDTASGTEASPQTNSRVASTSTVSVAKVPKLVTGDLMETLETRCSKAVGKASKPDFLLGT